MGNWIRIVRKIDITNDLCLDPCKLGQLIGRIKVLSRLQESPNTVNISLKTFETYCTLDLPEKKKQRSVCFVFSCEIC